MPKLRTDGCHHRPRCKIRNDAECIFAGANSTPGFFPVVPCHRSQLQIFIRSSTSLGVSFLTLQIDLDNPAKCIVTRSCAVAKDLNGGAKIASCSAVADLSSADTRHSTDRKTSWYIAVGKKTMALRVVRTHAVPLTLELP